MEYARTPRSHPGPARVLPLLLAACALLCSCEALRTPALMKALNDSGGAPDPGAPRVELSTRVARLAKSHMADAYVDPARVGEWLAAMGKDPAPVARLASCLVRPPGFDPQTCFDTFMDATAAGLWGLPLPPTAVEPLKDRASRASTQELDAERFIANARALASSLSALEKLVGRGPFPKGDVEAGIREGADRAGQYIVARRWHRSVTVPTTAVVLSGGAANGAFSAGLIWRLMETLNACREAPAGGCPGRKIDVVAGTSTGALIGLIIDMYSTPGRQRGARDLLVNSYTCSVNSDLYCVNDAWDWALVGDLKGLVRFDRIQEKIEKQIPVDVWTNDTEMVAVSVDFESGDVFAQSDQDPQDRGDAALRVNGVLASIVEPVLAEPVRSVARDGKPLPGTYLDGGVRSGLPLLEVVQRGAERVLVVSTSRIEPDRTSAPANAMEILMRTIDLLSGQPRIGEVQLGEFAAVGRRMHEHGVCTERLSDLAAKSRPDVTEYCERRSGFYPKRTGAESAAVGWQGPLYFRPVASSWKSSWIFRPEEEVETAAGYAFDPKVMRRLFELGAVTFQQRCPEILDLLVIEGRVASDACKLSAEEVVALARATYLPIDQCTADLGKVRTCN